MTHTRRSVAGVLLLLSLSLSSARAEGLTLTIDRMIYDSPLVTGLMMVVSVRGLEYDDVGVATEVTVDVNQGGTAYRCRVRRIQHMPEESTRTDARPGPRASQVTFTVPEGLRPGSATIVVRQRDAATTAFPVTVGERPGPPSVADEIRFVIDTTSDTAKPASPDFRPIRFLRGKVAELFVTPLPDPEAATSIAATFVQEGNRRVVPVTVRYVGERTISTQTFHSWTSDSFKATVAVPADLELGAAVLELRLTANGQTGEPAIRKVTIEDAAAVAAGRTAPRVLTVMPGTAGLGQAIAVFVESRASLGPDPTKARIVLEGGAQRFELSPDPRFIAPRVPGRETPLMLLTWPSLEMSGKFDLRVVNPSLGDEGASEPVAIEILPHILTPKLLTVRESTTEDTVMLARMREQSLAAGKRFEDFEPDVHRYLTIEATEFYNLLPENMDVRFTQDGREYTLRFADFSLQMDSIMVVRCPDELKAGVVGVELRNRVGSQTSAAATTTVTISGLPGR